jgi:hypothetical protein
MSSAQLHASAAFTPSGGNSSRYLLDKRLDGPHSRSERREKKILDPTGARTPTVVQHVASRCTDYAIPALVER